MPVPRPFRFPGKRGREVTDLSQGPRHRRPKQKKRPKNYKWFLEMYKRYREEDDERP